MTRLADGVLFGIGICASLFVAYLMGTYGVAPHYVALGVIAMGFFAARWLNPSVKINLTFVILS
jgi:hypothetical protein